MRNTHIIDRSRRTMLTGTGALMLGAALWPARVLAQSKAPIGIIGSGNIGGTIGELWVKAGHPVLFSSRHPEELKGLIDKLGPLAKAGTVAQAVEFGEVIFVAVPYGALPQIGKDNAAALKGKIVLDACNAVASRDGAVADEVEQNGIGVTSQKYLPGTRLVRAFNTMSFRTFATEANRAAPRLAIPIAGDDADAVKVASALIADAGFDAVVVGKLADARRFQRGNPGYGQPVSANELRQKLNLTQ